jgi:ankyrin repeat protein
MAMGGKRAAGSLIVLVSLAGSVAMAQAQTSPLLDAVKKGDKAAIRAVLAKHADVNAAEPDGTTPLHVAAQANDLVTAELLIQAGANVKAVNRYGVTPLSLACVNGSGPMILRLLSAGADVNAPLPGGETPLMTAARTGTVEAVTALLDHGADINAKETTRGQTALMWASGEGHVEAMKALLAHGADLKARENRGWTALLFAVREGQIDTVRSLLALGADVNEALIPPVGAGGRGRGGRYAGAGAAGAAAGAAGAAGPAGPVAPPTGPSALALAVESAHYELASLLLDKGAEPNADAQGWTPLHNITWIRKPGQASNGPAPKGSGNVDSLEMVRRLVAHGANVNARVTKRPNPGTTALNLLGGTPFFLAARTGDAPMMRLLVELGADPSIPNADGANPLMAAAGAGTQSPGEDAGTEAECLEAVKLALSLGNDPNVVDKLGNTVMHGAAYKQMPSVVKFLGANGARVDVWNRKNSLQWTPLRIAVGVHRGMNFRFHEPTAAALRELMVAAGVSTEVDPEPVISGGTPTK